MKRIFAFILTLLMIFSAVSCGGEAPAPVKDEGAKKEDLSALSADALYEKGLEKTLSLSAFAAESRLSLGEGEAFDTVKIARIREGYDGFSYSRTGAESVYFSEGVIYTETALGVYLAETSARDAREYMNAYFYPVQLLDAAWIGDLEKDGMTLRFSLKDETVLKLFAQAVPKDGSAFIPTSMTGEIEVSEDGVFETEKYTVSGQNAAGESVTLTVATEIVSTRSSEVSVSIPTTEYVSLDDIRIPHYLHDGKELLSSAGELQVTVLGSEGVKRGDKSWSLHMEETFYQKEGGDAYLSRQTLKNIPVPEEGAEEGAEETDPPVKPEDSRFYQFLLENGVKKENEYDVLTGTLLSENQAEGQSADWGAILDEVLLDPACLGELTVSKDLENITVSFTLKENGVRKLAERLISHLPESGLDVSAAVGTGSGVLTISAETYLLTAFSVALEGTAADASYSSRYSLTLDETENITFPAWQTPTATTPGEMGDVHDHVC